MGRLVLVLVGLHFERGRGRLSLALALAPCVVANHLAPTHYHALHNTNHRVFLPALVRPAQLVIADRPLLFNNLRPRP